MKGIDLTKCRGLNFKANILGTPCEGRIQVEDETVYLCQNIIGGMECIPKLGFRCSWAVEQGTTENLKKSDVKNLEIVPRDPETYKDWQVGDKVCEDEHRNACYEVIFRSGELVFFKDWNNWASNPMTCSEAFSRFGMRLVLTDIERQIIGEKKEKRYKPQAGDIVAWKEKEDEGRSAISIYRKKNRAYFTLFVDGVTGGLLHNLAMNIIRPATKDEKQKLFDAMAKKGMRWNAEKKVVEDIPKPYEFKKGEPVLVRDNGCVWKIGVFTKMRADYFQYGAMTNGLDECDYHFCIPYNEKTMHLLGTTEDYKEE